MKRVIVLILFTALFLVTCRFALVFGGLTFLLSILIFSKIEADQNVYDTGFWFTKIPSARLVFWLRAFGKLESIVKSILLGLLGWFIFAGNDQDRIRDSSVELCVAVVISYFFLLALVKALNLNVLRWAFVKFSMVVGVLFAVVNVLNPAKSRPLYESLWDNLKLKNPWAGEITVNQKADEVHLLTGDVMAKLHDKLGEMLGEPWASFVMILFNTQVLQGFLVVLYTFLLLLITEPMLRRNEGIDAGSQTK